MTRTAPHLVRPLPQLVPLHDSVSRRADALVMTALRAGDLLRRVARTSSSVLPGPRRISAVEALALAPGLRRGGLRGGLLSFDGQLVDDARLVLGLARTAAGFGAKVLTRVRVDTLAGDGARVSDELTARSFDIRARAVVNATGVWAGTLVPSVRLRPSLGTHLVLDATTTGLSGTALTIPVAGERNRFVLLLPQPDGRAYLGLTDEPMDGPIPDVPQAPARDVAFLLEAASAVLDRPVRPTDVLGSFAGLRPLVDGIGRSADLSRRHAVLTSPDGVVTVVGGKLTTYRRMAADAVDTVVRQRNLPAGPSRTRSVPLVGAAPRSRLSIVDAPDRLVARYGVEAPQVSAIAEPDPAVAEPLADGIPVTAAEVIWAVRHEGALDADDVLDRRTRIGMVAGERAAALPATTVLVARELSVL